MKTKESIVLFGFFAFVVLGLASCSDTQPNQSEIMRKNAEEYAKTKMNDPESFEFVSLVLIDSVLFSDNIEVKKNDFSKYLEQDQSRMKSLEEYKIEFPSLYDEKEVEELTASIEENQRILTKIDSIATQLGERTKEVASYTYSFSFRGNNAFGAKVLNEYLLQTEPAPSFKILNMTNESGKMISIPNSFPGYLEMIKKNL